MTTWHESCIFWKVVYYWGQVQALLMFLLIPNCLELWLFVMVVCWIFIVASPLFCWRCQEWELAHENGLAVVNMDIKSRLVVL